MKRQTKKIFKRLLIVGLLVVWLTVDWYGVKEVRAAAETKWASSHITGTFTSPTNANGATDTTWAGQVNANASETSRWAMEDPTGVLTGTQTVAVWARKGSNSGTPTVAVNLYENGSLVQSIVGATSVTSTTGQTVSGTFNASAITNEVDVEIEVVMVGVGGSPSARNAAQIDSVEWTVGYMPPAVTYTQNDFEWFETADSVTLTSIWPNGARDLAENSVIGLPVANTLLSSGDQVRLQVNFTVATVNLSASAQQFQLQYDAAEDCTTATGWAAVGAKASGTIWRLFDEASIGDSTAQVNNISTSTGGAEGYYSEINASGTAVNPNAVNIGQISEWDWPLENNGAATGTTYCFRMTLHDGASTATAFGTYNADSYPKLTTAPGTGNLLRHGQFFAPGKKGFFWAD